MSGMIKGRGMLLPRPHHLTQSEAIHYLRRQVLEDAIEAGWIEPCSRKPGRGKDTIFYRMADLEQVSLRIAGGEYPGAARGQ